jgi:hypothetical protein
MADDVIPVENTTASQERIERFLKLSGYKATDLTSTNKNTGNFTTDNGGKYNMDKAGKRITTLLGPVYPKFVKDEEEGADE